MALAEEANPWLTRSQGVPWLERLEREHDNLRAALVWSDTVSDTSMLARIAGALWLFWWMHGHFGDAARWLSRALDRPTESALRITVLQGAGNLAFYQEQATRSLGIWTELIELARPSGNQGALARGLGRS
jgi:hypothetical protein